MLNTTSIKNVSIEKFSASDGVLHYALLSSSNKKNATTVILHVHGLTGNFYGSTEIEEMSHGAISEGYAFMSIQMRGSYIINRFERVKGNRRKSFFAGSALEKFEDCIYDIEGAIKFLVDKGYKNIFLEGHSTGCQKIVYYMSKRKDSRVKGLVLLSPADDYNFERAVQGKKFDRNVKFARNVVKGHGNSLMPGMPPDTIVSALRFLSIANPKRPESRIFNYKMKDMIYISRIKLPALVVFGGKDYFMNTAGISADYAIKKLQEDCPSLKGIVIKDADHNFHGNRDTLTKSILLWISKTL